MKGVRVADHALHATPILSWYLEDFGPRLLPFIEKYGSVAVRKYLQERRGCSINLLFWDYDRGLADTALDEYGVTKRV
jgi:hypothetical protein